MVIADHLFARQAGGFVGVDVFFVISGFLITGVLLREGEMSGRVSILNFYKRRARRILPAALVVLTVTLIAAHFVFSTSRYESTRESAIWALIFLENWHLASMGTDYFQSGLPTSPVQHFWSLAVEEQFYVIWPVLLVGLLWGARRASSKGGVVHVRAWTGGFATAVIAGSFVWALYQSTHEPVVAYYSAWTRAWELAAGALLAAVGPSVMKRAPDTAREVLAGLGIVGLVASALVITPEVLFPAPVGALPVLAAVLVLASGVGTDRQVLAARPLTSWPMRYTGAISYSLYLWHWPIIIILSAVVEVSIAYYSIAVILTVVASVLSYHMVEQTFLNPVKRRRRPALVGGALVTVALLAAMAFQTGGTTDLSQNELERQALADQARARDAVSEGGEDWLQAALQDSLSMKTFPTLFPPLDDPYSDMAPEMREESGCLDPKSFTEAACTYGPADANRSVVVLGDSIAMSWMPGVRAALPTWRVHAVGLGNCPFAALDMKLDIAEQDRRCRDDYDAIIAHVNEMQPDIVIGSSLEYGIAYLKSGAEDSAAVTEWHEGVGRWARLLKPSGADLVILSPPPGAADPGKCFTRLAEPDDCATANINSMWSAKSEAERDVRATRYIDTRPWFCVESRCPAFAAGTTMRWDSVHITASYSKLLAPKLRTALLATSR